MTVSAAIMGCLVVAASCVAAADGESSQPSLASTPPPEPPCLLHDPPCPSSLNSTPVTLTETRQEGEVGGSPTPDGEVSTPVLGSSEKNPEVIDERDENDLPHEDEEAGMVVECIFDSFPLVGGPWLTTMVRGAFQDEVLLQGTHTFLSGGRLAARVVDMPQRSSAVKFLNFLSRCLDMEDFHPYRESGNENEVDQNTIELEETPETSSSPRSQNSKESRTGRSMPRSSGGYGGYGGGGGGGYGKKDSLIGFNLLGILVVGALITYLVFLLI